MKDVKKWLPGAIVSLGLIAAILYFVDLPKMVDALRNANYVYFGIALVIGFVWMAVRTQVWRTLLRDRASFSDVFWTVGEGYLLNNFLPFRLGEVGRAFLLSRKSKMTFMEIRVAHRPEEVGLVLEVPVHGAARHAGRRRHLRQRGAGHAPFTKEVFCGIEQPLPRGLGFFLGLAHHDRLAVQKSLYKHS